MTGGKKSNCCNCEKRLTIKRYVFTEVRTEPLKKFQFLILLLVISSICNKETESQLIAA